MKDKKTILILLTIMIAVSCTFIYQKSRQIKEPDVEQKNDIDNKEPEMTTLTDEEIKQIIIDTYFKKENSTITDYRFQSITINNITDELREELKYEKTDVLALVEYETQRNNEEEWIKENQSCFILRKGEDGKYFVYKAGSGW